MSPPSARRHRDAVAADLADRLGDALEQLGVVVDDVVAALDAAGLLVGEEGERRCRAAAWPRVGRGRGCWRGSSRPCPSCRPRRGPRCSRRAARPRAGRPASRRRWRGRRRGGRGCTAPAGRGPRPRAGRTTLVRPGSLSTTVGSRPDLAQLGHDVLGGLALPRPAAVAVVGAVDPDQVAADAHDLVDGAGLLGDLAHAPSVGADLAECGTAACYRSGSQRAPETVLAAHLLSGWRNGRRASLRC